METSLRFLDSTITGDLNASLSTSDVASSSATHKRQYTANCIPLCKLQCGTSFRVIWNIPMEKVATASARMAKVGLHISQQINIPSTVEPKNGCFLGMVLKTKKEDSVPFKSKYWYYLSMV